METALSKITNDPFTVQFNYLFLKSLQVPQTLMSTMWTVPIHATLVEKVERYAWNTIR